MTYTVMYQKPDKTVDVLKITADEFELNIEENAVHYLFTNDNGEPVASLPFHRVVYINKAE